MPETTGAISPPPTLDCSPRGWKPATHLPLWTTNSWLKPSSHHNHFWLRDYRRTFGSCFEDAEIVAIERGQSAFEKAALGFARIH